MRKMPFATGLALAALAVAGILWGITLPLTKVAVEVVPAGWLTAIRFGAAAPVLALLVGSARLRVAARPVVLLSGAVGYGAVVVLQNVGVAQTSVSHAALIVGTLPILVAVIERFLGRPVGRIAWLALGITAGGLVLVAAGAGGEATLAGDALVAASTVLAAGLVVAQPTLLRGRNAVAVTAVQFAGAAVAGLAWAALMEGSPVRVVEQGIGLDVVAALAALVVLGTLLPFTLFTVAQTQVSAPVAGTFINLEPLVGAAVGWTVFADPFGAGQAAGAVGVLAGLALFAVTALRGAPAPDAARAG